MFKPVNAKSIPEYLDMLPEGRREITTSLHSFIQQTVPSLKPHFAYNMIGYGKFPYRNYKKELLDWPVIALASQKNYLSLYVCAIIDGEYLAEKHQGELGRVSVGKSCIRFHKLADLNFDALAQVLKLAEANPGLITTK